jgi:hypothetical protein
VALGRVKRLQEHKHDLRVAALGATDEHNRAMRKSAFTKTGDSMEGVKRTAMGQNQTQAAAEEAEVEEPE